MNDDSSFDNLILGISRVASALEVVEGSIVDSNYMISEEKAIGIQWLLKQAVAGLWQLHKDAEVLFHKE